MKHASLTPNERAFFQDLDAQQFSRMQYNGLCILLEGVLAERIPGFHCHFEGNALHEAVGLCGEMLYEDQGFSAQEVKDGRAWLADFEGKKLKAFLAFYITLRKKKLQYQLDKARQRAGIPNHEQPT
jgi:hypothetical protein